jgi:hypothetical protein
MSLISDFREALAIEIEEQKKRGTARWDVRAGRLVEVVKCAVSKFFSSRMTFVCC